MNVFARELTDDLASLAKQIDAKIGENKEKKMSGFLVLLSEDPDADEGKLIAFAEKHLDSDEHEEEVDAALLKVRRGAPNNNKLAKLMTETGTERRIQRYEAVMMRDKVLHELDEELFYAVDEKANSINLTDKGRDGLSPEDRSALAAMLTGKHPANPTEVQ